MVLNRFIQRICNGTLVSFGVLILFLCAVAKLVPLLSTPCGTTGKDYCYDGCHWITN